MADFTGPAIDQPIESAAIVSRNSRLGLMLFTLYLAFYAGFVLLTAFRADWMRAEVAGLSIAILYGVALIGGAFVLAVIYLWLCRATNSH